MKLLLKMPKKAQRKKDLKEQKTSVTQSHFNCPVCLDLLRDPVTVPCGHSFCSGCLQGCWDQDENTGTYRCPQCRQTFSTRPTLGKNIMLAEMVEKMREENEGDEGTSHCYAEPGDEECSVCIGRKRKATMSCLECLNSYCESHFRSHEELFLIKKHKTIYATEPLKEKICGRHKKLVDVFCRKDQQCVCYECALESHRGHDTISAFVERAERQKQTNVAITQSIQEKENEVQEVRKAMDSLRLSAEALIEQNRSDFTTFTNSIMKWCCDLEKCVRGQERHQLSHARTQLSYLETEIRGLKRRRTELEQLSHTEDDVHFLKNFPSLYHPPEQSLWTCDEEHGVRAINGLDWAGLEKQVVNFCKEQMDKVTQKVRRVTLEGLTREDFIQYSKRLSLDPDTAYRHFYLSEDNTKLSWSNRCEQNGGDLKRFLHCRQVLCEQCLYGRCYWEVEWSTRYETSMAVSYIDIDRKDTGDKNRFGRNDQSWSLDCSDMKYEVRHNEIVIKIQRRPSSKRIAVYVDVGAGVLAFYEVSKTGILTTLHKHKTTFTKPLYAGFFGDAYTYLTICPLK